MSKESQVEKDFSERVLLISPLNETFEIVAGEKLRYIERVYLNPPAGMETIPLLEKYPTVYTKEEDIPELSKFVCEKDNLCYSVAIFLVDRAYGGPEEGGWWYDCGVPCEDEKALHTRFFGSKKDALLYLDSLDEVIEKYNEGRRDINSVFSEGEYRAFVCDGFPRPFPEETPHYE